MLQTVYYVIEKDSYFPKGSSRLEDEVLNFSIVMMSLCKEEAEFWAKKLSIKTDIPHEVICEEIELPFSYKINPSQIIKNAYNERF